MTAKELKQCAALYMSAEEIDAQEEPLLWRYQFKEHELEAFCAQLCKEQKLIDRKAALENRFMNAFTLGDAIINAQMPEL